MMRLTLSAASEFLRELRDDFISSSNSFFLSVLSVNRLWHFYRWFRFSFVIFWTKLKSWFGMKSVAGQPCGPVEMTVHSHEGRFNFSSELLSSRPGFGWSNSLTITSGSSQNKWEIILRKYCGNHLRTNVSSVNAPLNRFSRWSLTDCVVFWR